MESTRRCDADLSLDQQADNGRGIKLYFFKKDDNIYFILYILYNHPADMTNRRLNYLYKLYKLYFSKFTYNQSKLKL